VRFAHVTLAASPARISALVDFYARRLGLTVGQTEAGRIALAIGETTLELASGAGEPFYHVALLVPGDRFDAALAFAAERVPLLPGPDAGDVHVDFPAWSADACYFEDPAGNIVELIAHRGREERGASGPFEPAELLGVSEVGLVGDPPELAAGLARLGLEVWDGTVERPGQLAFVGEQARTLILAPEGRGWLPTGRRAEAHPVEVVVSGPRAGSAELDGGRYRVETAP
jgi:catechol 2,3-dioxygenase-like lactoylglutathione lyase family enzyme